MWTIVDKIQQEANAKAMQENFRRMQQEAELKAKAREEWVKSHTCAHCGRTDPIPPWLL